MNYIIYIIAAGSSLILGLLLKQPLLPEKPKRQSWTISAIFPTAVLALGFTGMVAKLGYLTNSNMDYITALAVGLITAVFSRFILEKILPRPAVPDQTSEINDPKKKPPQKSESSENLIKKSSFTEKSFEKKNTSEKPSEESDKKSEVSKIDKSSKSQEESHG